MQILHGKSCAKFGRFLDNAKQRGVGKKSRKKTTRVPERKFDLERKQVFKSHIACDGGQTRLQQVI